MRLFYTSGRCVKQNTLGEWRQFSAIVSKLDGNSPFRKHGYVIEYICWFIWYMIKSKEFG